VNDASRSRYSIAGLGGPSGVLPALSGRSGSGTSISLKDRIVSVGFPDRGVHTVAAYDQPGLRPVGAVYVDGQHWDETLYALPDEAASVVAVLYYQTASKEYIDFLRTRGGADGAVLGQMWDDLKSPPEVMATAMAPARKQYFPLIVR